MTNAWVLQLGAGKEVLNVRPGERLVRVDLRREVQPDLVWDLNAFPWPLRDGLFQRIHCTDVLEHLDDLVGVMEEIHRIGCRGARVHIAMPHYSSSNSFTDPTHRHHLGISSFDYFTGATELDFYSKVRFAKRRAELFFHPTPLNKIIWRLARHRPELYERRFAWIFPAWFMSFELEVLK